MFIENFGGVQIFALSQSNENTLSVEAVYKDSTGNIQEETSFKLSDKESKNDKKFNMFCKRDLNTKLSQFIDKVKVKSIKFFESNDKTLIDVSILGKEYKGIEIDWRYVKDQISIPAPYSSGEKVIDSRLFSSNVYNDYLTYFLNADSSSEEFIIGQLNLMLFLETVENQRNINLLNILMSLRLILESYKNKKESFFKKVGSSFEDKNIKMHYSFNVESDFKVNADISLTYNDKTYIIHNEKGILFNGIVSFYKDYFKANDNDFEIVFFSENYKSNAKHLLYDKSILYKGEDIFSVSEKEIELSLLSLRNVLINEEGYIIEVYTPEEMIKIFFDKILKAI